VIDGAWSGPSNAVGFPFGFITAAATDSAGNYPRVNLCATTGQANNYFNITATLTDSTSGPVVWEGYTSTPGDGGMATIDGGSSGITLAYIIGAEHEFRNIVFANSSTSGAYYGMRTSGSAIIRHCIAHTSGRCGFYADGNGTVIYDECEAYDCGKAGGVQPFSSGFGYHGNGLMVLVRCYSHNNSTAGAGGFGNDSGYGIVAVQSIADSNAAQGWEESSGYPISLVNCDAYNNGGDGIKVGGALHLSNCNLVKNTGWGINKLAAGHGTISNCGFGAGTQANGGGTVSSVVGTHVAGTVNYASGVTPWVAPTTGNFSINLAAAEGVGRGSFTQTGNSKTGTVGYPDIGAAARVFQTIPANTDVRYGVTFGASGAAIGLLSMPTSGTATGVEDTVSDACVVLGDHYGIGGTRTGTASSGGGFAPEESSIKKRWGVAIVGLACLWCVALVPRRKKIALPLLLLAAMATPAYAIREVPAGTTSYSVVTALHDSTGACLTGKGGTVTSYSYLTDSGVSGSGTCVAGTLSGFIDHGFIESGTAGLYRLGVPDSALTTAGGLKIKLSASGAVDQIVDIQVYNATQGLSGSGPTVISGTVSDKGGYTLSQAFPQNFSSLTISGSGSMVSGTVSDKGGYSGTATVNGYATNQGPLYLMTGGTQTLSVGTSGYVTFNNTSIDTVTTLSNLPAIPANWLTAAGIAGSALNGKGDWLLSSGYTAPDNTDIATIVSNYARRTGDYSTYAGGDTAGVTTLLTRIIGTLAAGTHTAQTGNGSNVVPFVVTDNNGSPLQNASVRAFINGGLAGGTTTNIAGGASLNLNGGSYAIAVSCGGFQFGGATLSVPSGGTMTYAMTPITIPSSDPSFCTLYTYVYDNAGNALQGKTISLQLQQGPTAGVAYDTTLRTATSGSDGKVSFVNCVPGGRYAAWRGAVTPLQRVFTVPTAQVNPYPIPALQGQ
jgi:hypothetical protein